MAIDTVTPRSRRALLFGALGGAIATAAAVARPAATRAGVDGDVVLGANNTAAGTTQITATIDAPVLRVVSEDNVGVIGASGSAVVDIPPPIATSTGLYGASAAGHGVYGASDSGIGVYAANNSATKAALVAEGGPGTAIHGHANAGPVPSSPALTGIYGSATGAGVAVAANSASGLALRATSSAGHGIRGRGQLDGVVGESPGGRSGVVGYSGPGIAPAGPGKTGVYGEATQDTASRGVSGYSLSGQGVRGQATTGQGVQGIATSGQALRGDANGGTGAVGYSGPLPAPAALAKVGVLGVANQDTGARGVFGRTTVGQGVRGEATSSGIGVRAVSATGNALDVAGKVKLSRSGIASVPANKDFVDVAITPISATSMVFATMQMKRTGVWVIGARPAWPSAGFLRIYLNKVGSTTAATPVAWAVLL